MKIQINNNIIETNFINRISAISLNRNDLYEFTVFLPTSELKVYSSASAYAVGPVRHLELKSELSEKRIKLLEIWQEDKQIISPW